MISMVGSTFFSVGLGNMKYRVSHKECDFSDDIKLLKSSEFEVLFFLYLK